MRAGARFFTCRKGKDVGEARRGSVSPWRNVSCSASASVVRVCQLSTSIVAVLVLGPRRPPGPARRAFGHLEEPPREGIEGGE
jgi:hypothetical protein